MPARAPAKTRRRFTAGRFSYYDPGMTDEFKELGLTEAARPVPKWVLLAIAAVAIAAYAFFLIMSW
jgi:hypothetical protein